MFHEKARRKKVTKNNETKSAKLHTVVPVLQLGDPLLQQSTHAVLQHLVFFLLRVQQFSSQVGNQ